VTEIVVKSEISGTVFRMRAAIGDRVQEGDELLILESMKMEIPVAAPRAGLVATLLVKEGQSIAEGQALAILVA